MVAPNQKKRDTKRLWAYISKYQTSLDLEYFDEDQN